MVIQGSRDRLPNDEDLYAVTYEKVKEWYTVLYF